MNPRAPSARLASQSPNQALIISAVLAALAVSLPAQVQFDELAGQGLPTLLDRTVDIALGDVDGDGDLDIVTANFQGGTRPNPIPGQTQLYLNNGYGVFRSVTSTLMPTLSDNVAAIALGDFDGDGDLDLVSGTQGQNKLYLNNGLGGFTDATAGQMPVSSAPTWSVAMGDIDGDGDLDLAFGNINLYRQNTLLINNGSGTFTDATTAQLPADSDDTRSLAMGDLDGDGDLDIVCGNYPQPSRIYVNNGNGVFTDVSAARLPSPPSRTTSLALGDVDGDGRIDIVFGAGNNYGRGQNRLYLNSTTGSFADVTATHMPLGVANCEALALGDLDSDGDLDLFVGNAASSYFGVFGYPNSLYLNNGAGVFVDVSIPRLGGAAEVSLAAALGDVDGDGDLDLSIGNGSGQNRLLTNLLRQLHAPTAPQVGQPYTIDIYTRYGPPRNADLALPYVSTASASIPAAPFGILGIDPAQAVPLPWLVIPQPAGVASSSVFVPNDPALVGLSAHSQALLLQPPLQARLTNVTVDPIR